MRFFILLVVYFIGFCYWRLKLLRKHVRWIRKGKKMMRLISLTLFNSWIFSSSFRSRCRDSFNSDCKALLLRNVLDIPSVFVSKPESREEVVNFSRSSPCISRRLNCHDFLSDSYASRYFSSSSRNARCSSFESKWWLVCTDCDWSLNAKKKEHFFFCSLIDVFFVKTNEYFSYWTSGMFKTIIEKNIRLDHLTTRWWWVSSISAECVTPMV